MNLAIVGTGTDVGKTIVAAVVLARYGGELPLAYWKPVASGARDGRDTATVRELAGERAEILAESYLFDEPLSPHLAARLAGRRIDPAVLLADFDRHLSADRPEDPPGGPHHRCRLIIELAGGLLVPLTEADGPAGTGSFLQSDLLHDLAARAGLACLVVGSSRLGTINHTLLTLEALRARGLPIAGVVLDGPPNAENRLAIERLGRVEPVFELPPLVPLDRAAVAAAAARFDPDGRLGSALRSPDSPPAAGPGPAAAVVMPAGSSPPRPLASTLPLSPSASDPREAAPTASPAGSAPAQQEAPTAPPAGSAPAQREAPPPAPSATPAGSPPAPREVPPLPAPNEAASSPPWMEADRRHVWHPYTQMLTAPPPLPVVRAEGVYLYTADGRRLLDGISSWWVNIHGHNHPRLNRALAAQAERLAQVIFAGFTHEPAARLAAELAARAPGRLPWVFYSDDGSTAVEVALKMAHQHWRHRGEPGRTLFVAFDDAYHGDTFGAMAAGGVAAFHAAFRDLFFAVCRAQTPSSAARGSSSPPLAEILEREGPRVAAVILEPMLQGAGGMLVQPAAWLREVRELTRRHGVPLIADEVLTGFGRTGRMFACEHGPVEPDLLCVSKALTGGYLPLSATLASDEIYRAFLATDRSRTFFHGHSFTGNALACAVALASLELFDEENLLGRIARLERLFAGRLAALASHPSVAAVRHLGGMAAVELRRDAGGAGGAGGYLDGLGPVLAQRFLDRGLLLRPLGNVIYLLPPYVITDEEAAGALDTVADVLDGI